MRFLTTTRTTITTTTMRDKSHTFVPPFAKLVGERERETKKAFSREEERNCGPLHSSSSLSSVAAIADLAVYNITQVYYITQVSQCKERAPLPHIIVDVCVQAQLVFRYLPHLT